MNSYEDFTKRLKLLISKNPLLIATTFGNIFTMRLIGNKTHGDLAEIAMTEFVNQYMYDFKAKHVGKDLYRAKEREEDIQIINEITNVEFPVSLKAYGAGPLQLSTDKTFSMFPRLEKAGESITKRVQISAIFEDPAFLPFNNTNILPLIYNEKEQKCNIMVFDSRRARADTARIVIESEGKGRRHPVYRFYNRSGEYICEVRYGGADSNALQRGLWTHTQKGGRYFDSITNGWIDYSHNLSLVSLFSYALVATQQGHDCALRAIKKDIDKIKQQLKR